MKSSTVAQLKCHSSLKCRFIQTLRNTDYLTAATDAQCVRPPHPSSISETPPFFPPPMRVKTCCQEQLSTQQTCLILS